jgi:hypothetical protein
VLVGLEPERRVRLAEEPEETRAEDPILGVSGRAIS